MLWLTDRGVPEVEIAWRFRRTPRFVRQVKELAAVPRDGGKPDDRRLRPIERCILRWRDEGHDFDVLAPRFRRSPGFLAQVERLARYKLAQR